MTDFKNQNKSLKEIEKKTNYNNYSQRKYDNLNSLYANNNKWGDIYGFKRFAKGIRAKKSKWNV